MRLLVANEPFEYTTKDGKWCSFHVGKELFITESDYVEAVLNKKVKLSKDVFIPLSCFDEYSDIQDFRKNQAGLYLRLKDVIDAADIMVFELAKSVPNNWVGFSKEFPNGVAFKNAMFNNINMSEEEQRRNVWITTLFFYEYAKEVKKPYIAWFEKDISHDGIKYPCLIRNFPQELKEQIFAGYSVDALLTNEYLLEELEKQTGNE